MVREIHSNDINEKRPYFLKIINADNSTDHLEIPPSFLKHIWNELSERATLKLKAFSGFSWNVNVIKTRSGVYLRDGWQEFLKHNSLGDYEFLIFRYDGKMHFTIQIFGRNGCERVEFPNTRTHQNPTFANTKRPRESPVIITKCLHPSSKSCKDNSAGKNLPSCGSDKFKEVKEEEEDPTFANTKRPRGTLRKSSVVSTKHLRPSLKSFEDNSAEGKNIPSCESDKLKEEEEDYQDQAAEDWETAESFKSKYPHFKSIIRRTYCVAIPTPFSREHLSPGKFKASLKNSKGNTWEVSFVPYGGTHQLCKGWVAFARANQVKLHDVCIFELVSRNKMVVHIFRKCESDYKLEEVKEEEEDPTFTDTKRHRGRPSKSPVISTKQHLRPPLKSFKFNKAAGKNLPSCESNKLKEVKEEEEYYQDNTAENWETAKSFKSKFPHFESVIRSHYSVAIPTPFSREHLPPGKFKVSLKNSQGNTWEVSAVPSNATYKFCKGWVDFTRANHVKLDDVCIFELVSTNKMVVHIFRN